MTLPASRDLILVGGGHSHALAIRMLAMKPVPDTRLTLVSPDSLAPYSGMLPGLVAGHYSLEDTHIDLVRLCEWAGVRFVRDRVTAIDPEHRQLTLADSPALAYDLASLDIGATPSLDAVPGAREQAVPVKPVSSFRQRWQELLEQLSARREPARVAVVGAGAGGTEMVLAVAHALQRHGLKADLHLVDAAGLLPEHPPRARRFMARRLAHYGIQLHEHFPVERVEPGKLHGPATLDFDFLLWCTGATGPDWLRDSPLATTDAGLVRVDQTLRSISHDNLFAAGDCAWLEGAALPRAGVYAVRQAPVLTDNLRAAATGRPLKPYRPQRRVLSLLSGGSTVATGNRGSHLLQGAALWRWKNRIDRRFMARFTDLPERRMPAPPEEEPRCAGCGSKVGAEALREALAGLEPINNPDVAAGLNAAEDAALIHWPSERMLVQTQDYFPAFLDEPWLFGRIAALHALSDAWAMGAQPHSALATATVPVNHPRLQGRDLERLMAGAVKELNSAGCTLVGGHSLEGPQMAAGFTINATGDEQQLLRKSGARPGDALVLTKALGTGILLAGLMRQRTRGPWLDAAVESMLTGNGEAAAILAQHGATACTDITGFGLLGHLLELCQAGKVGCELNAEDVPVLPGALTLAAEGLASTLAPANRAVLARCEPGRFGDHPLLDILTDPQTNGGLLATMAPEQARDCVTTLRARGLKAGVVGRITEADTAMPLRLRERILD